LTGEIDIFWCHPKKKGGYQRKREETTYSMSGRKPQSSLLYGKNAYHLILWTGGEDQIVQGRGRKKLLHKRGGEKKTSPSSKGKEAPIYQDNG